MTVCVVDDSRVTLARLRVLLNQAGAGDLKLFDDSRLALDWCLQHPPRLLLLDYNMPELDGLSLLGKLRESAVGRQIPVALVSGWALESLRQRALAAGAVDVIGKPFSAEEFRLKVQKLLAVTPARVAELSAASTHRQRVLHEQPDSSSLEYPDGEVIRILERIAAIRADRPLRSAQLVARLAAIIAAAHGLDLEAQQTLLRATPFYDFDRWTLAAEAGQARPPAPIEPRATEGPALAGHRLFSGYSSPVLRMAAQLALTHRERWDGEGYPNRLRGAEIPVAGRIVALAATFERLVSQATVESRRHVFELAASVVAAESGRRFDPAVVAAFEKAKGALFVALIGFGQPSARSLPQA